MIAYTVSYNVYGVGPMIWKVKLHQVVLSFTIRCDVYELDAEDFLITFWISGTSCNCLTSQVILWVQTMIAGIGHCGLIPYWCKTYA